MQHHPGVVHLVQVLRLRLLEDDLPLALDLGRPGEVNQPIVLEGHLRAKDDHDPTYFLSDLSPRLRFTLVLSPLGSDPFYLCSRVGKVAVEIPFLPIFHLILSAAQVNY